MNGLERPGSYCADSGKMCGWFLAVALLFSVSNAHARGTEARERLARKACLSGDSKKGIEILSGLFVDTKDPTWIYNQGRCLEQNSRYEEAISRFEEYLRLTKGGEAKDRAEAEEHVADCQTKLGKAILPMPPAQAPAPVVVQAPVRTEPVQDPVVQQAVPAQTHGSGLRTAGVIVVAVGGASLVTAAILNLKANSMAKELNNPSSYDRDKASQRDNYVTLGWVGYGVGAACVVGGAVLYYLGYSAHSTARVSFVPTLAQGHAGVVFQGAF